MLNANNSNINSPFVNDGTFNGNTVSMEKPSLNGQQQTSSFLFNNSHNNHDNGTETGGNPMNGDGFMDGSELLDSASSLSFGVGQLGSGDLKAETSVSGEPKKSGKKRKKAGDTPDDKEEKRKKQAKSAHQRRNIK